MEYQFLGFEESDTSSKFARRNNVSDNGVEGTDQDF